MLSGVKMLCKTENKFMVPFTYIICLLPFPSPWSVLSRCCLTFQDITWLDGWWNPGEIPNLCASHHLFCEQIQSIVANMILEEVDDCFFYLIFTRAPSFECVSQCWYLELLNLLLSRNKSAGTANGLLGLPSSKMDETEGVECLELEHSNWTICCPLSPLCIDNFPFSSPS